MFQNKNLSVLSSNLLFKGIDEAAITPVFNSKNFRAEKEGELIFQANDESSYLYLILQGEVKLKYAGTRGSNASFRRVKNEFFGEQETLEKTPRISSAVADTDCIFYLISREDLFNMINENRRILKNLSFVPSDDEENEEELTENIQPEQNEESNQTNTEEKQVEEIVMDEDLADYSFDSPAIEELRDFHDENYLSYSDNDDTAEDINFGGNGFHPEENNFVEKDPEEFLADYIKNEAENDVMPQEPEEYVEPNSLLKDEDLIPAINDFEHIPEQPQKFEFYENETINNSGNVYQEEKQQETETLTLIESAAKFINTNVSFPLSEIKKLSGVLSKNPGLPEAEQVNNLISSHISSVESIINSSMEFISHKNNLNLAKQNIRSVLNNILNLLSEYVETRKVHLYKKIDTEAETEVDEVKLYNVFLQLAKNACDSMPEGGNIFVTAVKEDNCIRIEFIDEGIGIPSSITFDIFEPMFTHGKEDGAGLGLSIAKKIITDHNGSISVDGEIGEGTRIIVTLPVKD